VKLAHLADLHLGFRQFERLTARGGNQREADVAEALRRAVDDLIEQRPDLVLFAGDVFHSVRPTNAAIVFLFRQLQRLQAALPEVSIVIVAGNHDTPRSAETGTILRLYEALGVEVVIDQPRRVMLPKLDCAVLAVPTQSLWAAERPALRPDRGVARNVLVMHADVEGSIGDVWRDGDPGPTLVTRAELGLAQWDYVALGHYHVAHELAANAWYAGSLDYVTTNPWGELADARARGRAAKGYLVVEVPAARVEFRAVEPPRRFVDLPTLDVAGLSAADVDARIAQRVHDAQPAIDDHVVRLVVTNVTRATAADLDHAAIRGYKARALNFHLDLRRPETRRETGTGAPGSRRRALPETVREFLGRRPLDAALDRETFVALGMSYLAAADAPDEGPGA
jgi:DNA repair exonuclease SbcCD nuclease subunit